MARLLRNLAWIVPTLLLLNALPVKAVCYGVETTERYYSDATYTVQVGKCIENECRGTYICTGQQTDFVQGSSRGILCHRCDPACGQCLTGLTGLLAPEGTGSEREAKPPFLRYLEQRECRAAEPVSRPTV